MNDRGFDGRGFNDRPDPRDRADARPMRRGGPNADRPPIARERGEDRGQDRGPAMRGPAEGRRQGPPGARGSDFAPRREVPRGEGRGAMRGEGRGRGPAMNTDRGPGPRRDLNNRHGPRRGQADDRGPRADRPSSQGRERPSDRDERQDWNLPRFPGEDTQPLDWRTPGGDQERRRSGRDNPESNAGPGPRGTGPQTGEPAGERRRGQREPRPQDTPPPAGNESAPE